VQALLKQTSDTNSEVRRNAFSNLSEVIDHLNSANCEFLLSNLIQMVSSNDNNSEPAALCLSGVISHELSSNKKQILDNSLKQS